MKKVVVFFTVLLGCIPAQGQSCDLCGKWHFERFEYSGRITTDCADTAQRFYDDTYFIIGQHHFFKTYMADNTPNEFDDVDIVGAGYDSNESTDIILVKSNNDITEKLYKTKPDTIYLDSDGCKFYFKRY